MKRDLKTKRIGGTDLSTRNFLWVGNPKNPDTWKLPVFDPTSITKTIALINNSIHRFDEVARHIPLENQFALRAQLTGAAQSHGLSESALMELTQDEIALLLAERAATNALADIADEYE